MAAYHTQQINVGSVQAPEVGSIFTDLADRLSKNYQQGLQNTKTGAELARAQVLNQRADEKYARDIQEQQAADAYNAEIARGAQVKGGVLNTEALIKESDKYGLTPQEIEDSKTYMDEASARAAGKTALADKLAWQNKLSNAANQIAESGIAKESRPEMYERAMEGVRGKGLPVLAPMVTSLDQARLAEIEAENAKVKDLDSRIADVRKDEVSNARWAINAQGSGSNVTDADGNVIGTTAGTTAGAKRGIKLDDKYDDKVGRGERDILESVKKLKVGDAGLAGEDALKLYREILKDPTVDPESAAAAVTQGIGTKEDAWYNPFDSATGTFKRGAVDALTPLLKGTRTPEVVGSTGNVGVEYNTKANEARDLAKIVGNQNEATLAQLKSDKVKLLAGEDSRRTSRVDDALRSVGVLPSSKVSVNDTTTVGDYADKVRKSEGKYTDVNKTSGALGAYQFLPSTLEGLKKQTGEKFTNEEFLSNPSLQDKYFGLLTKSNAGRLEALGLEPTSTNLYIAHNLGPGYAKEMQNLDTPPSKGLQKALEANNLDSKEEWYERNKKYASTSVKDLIAKSEKMPAVKEAEMVLRENKGGPLDEFALKQRLKNDRGLDDVEAKQVIKEAKQTINEPKEKERSDYLIADRNYRIAKRVGGKYDGKTAEEWDELRSTTNKIGDYGWAAPIAAALPAAIGLAPAAVPGTALMIPEGSAAETLAGGTAKRVINEMYFPKVRELVTKPLTKEVREELLGIAQKAPGDIRKGIVQYLQRAEKLGK